jgi:hypothetical protein
VGDGHSLRVKRLQIYIETIWTRPSPSAQCALIRPRAELIRGLIAERLGGSKRTSDPLDALVGSVDAELADVDAIVYGP